MFKNVLVSINWSGTGVDAAALARTLCSDDGQLTLAHVHAEVPLSPDPVVKHLRKFELRQSVRALRGASYATGIVPTLSVGAASTAEGLVGLASMIGADLLVLGPLEPGSREFEEVCAWGPGRSRPAAVAITRRGFATRETPLRRIGVIAGEGNGPGETARALADRHGSRIRIFETGGPASTRRRMGIARRQLAQFSSGVDLMVGTDPAQALDHVATAATLIVDANRLGVLPPPALLATD